MSDEPDYEVQYVVERDGLYLANDRHSVSDDFFWVPFDAPFMLLFDRAAGVHGARTYAYEHDGHVCVVVNGFLCP